jgi:hypothetical protein
MVSSVEWVPGLSRKRSLISVFGSLVLRVPSSSMVQIRPFLIDERACIIVSFMNAHLSWIKSSISLSKRGFVSWSA